MSDKDKRLLEYGRRYERQLHRRKYWIMAAVFVLVLAMGMTSVGGPQRFFNRVIDRISGREQEMVDSEDGIVLTDGWDEEEAYDAIEEKYGFRPVKLDYLPEGTIFDSVEINDEIQEVKLIYSQKGKLCIQMIIYPNYRDGSVGIDYEDQKQQEYIMDVQGKNVVIKEYLVLENQRVRWCALFSQGNTMYSITAIDLEQTEFEQVVTNLFF